MSEILGLEIDALKELKSLRNKLANTLDFTELNLI